MCFHNNLRDSIFNLQTRKFGNVVEKLLERILHEFGFKVRESEDTSYDIEINSKKDEVKGSRVLSKSVLDLKNDNIIESIMNHEKNRYVSLVDSMEVDWDCNIQQIKTTLFNDLWYVLFFSDHVVIFKINNKQIIQDSNILYCNKQHRFNEGEGQFHITNRNIKYHLDNYFIDKITYDEVYKKLNKK